jgi:hypothetical protein
MSINLTVGEEYFGERKNTSRIFMTLTIAAYFLRDFKKNIIALLTTLLKEKRSDDNEIRP